MDIIAQLKIERDKAAQQVNALNMADNECRCQSKNFSISKSTMGTHTG